MLPGVFACRSGCKTNMPRHVGVHLHHSCHVACSAAWRTNMPGHCGKPSESVMECHLMECQGIPNHSNSTHMILYSIWLIICHSLSICSSPFDWQTSFGHSILHIFWHTFCQSMWHIFWHSIWNSIWHIF